MESDFFPTEKNITSELGDWRDENLAQWEIATLAVIFVVTILGNSLVLFSIYLRRCRGRRQRLTRMHFFVMHLSIADLITALFNVLPQLIWKITFRFKGGPLLCKPVKFCQPLGGYLSSYVLTATAVDRYHAICYPLSYCKTTSRRSRIMVYSAWVLALLLCIPQIFIFSFIEISPGVWDCWATFPPFFKEKVYITWYSITVFVLPFCALTFTYVRICCSIWTNRGVVLPADFSKQNVNKSSLISKAKISTVKQTLSVVTLYAASSIPFIGCLLISSWVPGASFLTEPVQTILALLSSLTSCVNPWIYLTFSHELRTSLTQCLCSLVKLNRPPGLGRGSTKANSNGSRSSKRSSLLSRVTRYTTVTVQRPDIHDGNVKNNL